MVAWAESGGVAFQTGGYGINQLLQIPAGVGGGGGDGGAAEILYDDTAPELERKVVIVNRGGPGGRGAGGPVVPAVLDRSRAPSPRRSAGSSATSSPTASPSASMARSSQPSTNPSRETASAARLRRAERGPGDASGSEPPP